ncbi:hypothetical protein [Nonomuraea sp. NPDC003214]
MFAPAHLVIGLPLVVGAVSGGWAGLGWGAAAAALCGGVPALVIRAGVRSGRFGDRHVGERSQRPWLVGVIAGLVVAALALLVVLGAPWVMIVCVAIMLATLAVVGPITLAWKISFHTAVAAGSVVMLAATVPPGVAAVVGGAGALLVGAIAWSRSRLGDHTPAQTAAGAAAGAAATWATIAVML